MDNKCNTCAKFLTCNRKKCKKVTFVEAGILEKPKIITEHYKYKDYEKDFKNMAKEFLKTGVSTKNG